MRLRFNQIGTDRRAGSIESWAIASDGSIRRVPGPLIPACGEREVVAEGRVEGARGVGSVRSAHTAAELKPLLKRLDLEFPGTRWLVFERRA